MGSGSGAIHRNMAKHIVIWYLVAPWNRSDPGLPIDGWICNTRPDDVSVTFPDVSLPPWPFGFVVDSRAKKRKSTPARQHWVWTKSPIEDIEVFNSWERYHRNLSVYLCQQRRQISQGFSRIIQLWTEVWWVHPIHSMSILGASINTEVAFQIDGQKTEDPIVRNGWWLGVAIWRNGNLH